MIEFLVQASTLTIVLLLTLIIAIPAACYTIWKEKHDYERKNRDY